MAAVATIVLPHLAPSCDSSSTRLRSQSLPSLSDIKLQAQKETLQRFHSSIGRNKASENNGVLSKFQIEKVCTDSEMPLNADRAKPITTLRTRNGDIQIDSRKASLQLVKTTKPTAKLPTDHSLTRPMKCLLKELSSMHKVWVKNDLVKQAICSFSCECQSIETMAERIIGKMELSRTKKQAEKQQLVPYALAFLVICLAKRDRNSFSMATKVMPYIATSIDSPHEDIFWLFLRLCSEVDKDEYGYNFLISLPTSFKYQPSLHLIEQYLFICIKKGDHSHARCLVFTDMPKLKLAPRNETVTYLLATFHLDKKVTEAKDILLCMKERLDVEPNNYHINEFLAVCTNAKNFKEAQWGLRSFWVQRLQKVPDRYVVKQYYEASESVNSEKEAEQFIRKHQTRWGMSLNYVLATQSTSTATDCDFYLNQLNKSS
ncbi:MAG: hypothetical protein ACPGUD_08705 [Parashewanella sp.]